MTFDFLSRIWRFWRLIAIYAKYAIFAEIATSKGPLCHQILTFVYSLAINRHFCRFRQNRHFPKGPFANSFEFLFTVWRFWRLIAISVSYTKYSIFVKIATFQRAPLTPHLNFCLQLDY